MPRKANLLNIKAHLSHIQEILDGLQEYGYSPLIKHECRIASLINKGILKKHNANGTRKDIYVPK